MGLTALEPCVKARLNRPISQPLDLASLRSFKEEMRGQPVAPDVAAAPPHSSRMNAMLCQSLFVSSKYFFAVSALLAAQSL